MDVSLDLLLTRWTNFYVIVGSGAAALMGLQFVVIALSAGSEVQATAEAFTAFNTPTVVHFATVLLIAGVINAPWPSEATLAMAVAAAGAGGLAYMIVALARMRRQAAYQMVLEDRIFHAVLPVAAYTGAIAASIALALHPAAALFGVAGAALLLMFIGVHNAWDNATYVAIRNMNQRAAKAAAAAGTKRDVDGGG